MTQEELKEKRERFRVYGEICLMMEEKGYGDCMFEADELEEALGEPILVFVDDDDDHAQKLDSIEFADCMLWLRYGENYVMFMDVCSWTLHQIYQALKNIFNDGEKQGEQKPAWSEEDEYCRNQLIVFCENCMVPDNGAIRCANWLKSLKDRVQPQSQWKPSEEMLEALYKVIPGNVMAISEDEMLLDKLYQGLKYGRVLKK